MLYKNDTIEDLQSEYISRMIKSFYFLIREGYVPINFSFGLMAYPSMVFECHKNEYLLHVGIAGNDYGTSPQLPNQEIYVSRSTRWSRFKDHFTFYSNSNKRRKNDCFFFQVDDYFEEFGFHVDKSCYTLEEAVLFIRQNLMPIIKGEMWIDELIIRKNKLDMNL